MIFVPILIGVGLFAAWKHRKTNPQMAANSTVTPSDNAMPAVMPGMVEVSQPSNEVVLDGNGNQFNQGPIKVSGNANEARTGQVTAVLIRGAGERQQSPIMGKLGRDSDLAQTAFNAIKPETGISSAFSKNPPRWGTPQLEDAKIPRATGVNVQTMGDNQS